MIKISYFILHSLFVYNTNSLDVDFRPSIGQYAPWHSQDFDTPQSDFDNLNYQNFEI